MIKIKIRDGIVIHKPFKSKKEKEFLHKKSTIHTGYVGIYSSNKDILNLIITDSPTRFNMKDVEYDLVTYAFCLEIDVTEIPELLKAHPYYSIYSDVDGNLFFMRAGDRTQ